MAEFNWHPNEPPPRLEEHTKAKLNVLRRYLSAYFDRLNSSPFPDHFKLDLVDGFCGGGTFTDEAGIVSGSPLIMLEEARAARERLNERRTKQLHVDCKFYFVDKEQAHIDHLTRVLAERDHNINDGSIVVRQGTFKEALPGILESIGSRRPRTGRSVFLLDQTGFAQVELNLVETILTALPWAEVILTFAADALINHLAATPAIIKAVAPLDLSTEQIIDLVRDRDSRVGRAFAQRTLRPHILGRTGATYDTPFFIRPEKSRRSLWFLHLSKHATARDVMVQQHWAIHNTFEHDGSGGLDMMGWDALKESSNLTLFSFEKHDEKTMYSELLESLPRELSALAADAPITIETVHHLLANRTAARFSDLDDVILRLMREREFLILRPDGKRRFRSLKHLRLDDRIAFPDTRLLPGISRIRT